MHLKCERPFREARHSGHRSKREPFQESTSFPIAEHAALKALLPHTVPGSVLLFDELTWAGAPGEAIAFKQVFADVRYTIEKCQFYPSKSLVTLL